MGYNPQWEGALHPSRPIPQETVALINSCNYDVCVASEESECNDGEVGDIVPACRNMPGRCLAEDILRVQKILEPHKIKLSGEILWTGDAHADYGKIEVRRGKVQIRYGVISYGRPKPVNLDRWSVKVKRHTKDGKWKTCGWVVSAGFNAGTAVAWCCDDTPPMAAYQFDHEDEAYVAANAHTDKTHRCEVVKVEATR